MNVPTCPYCKQPPRFEARPTDGQPIRSCPLHLGDILRERQSEHGDTEWTVTPC